MSRKRPKSESGLHPEAGSSTMNGHLSEVQEAPEVTPVLSYASILRNRVDDSMVDAEVELSDGDCCYSRGKDGVGLCFSEHAHEVLRGPWRSAVVVRLMGKPSSVNSFDFMLRSLRRKWRSNGGWKLIDLLNDWFVVKFELEEDMEDVLCGGPWVIAGQTLVVKRWSAEFNPVSDEIGSLAVWARIIGLPVMYFSGFAMRKIGQLLGGVVKVDPVTLGQERGRFARVCVEMDLSKPFRSSILVDNVCYKVQYEGLSLLCFGCGVYGHSKEKCPAVCGSVEPIAEVQEPVITSVAQVCGEGVGDDGETNRVRDVESMTSGNCAFGPWMLVNYRSKKKGAKDSLGTLPSPGSRFAVLQGEGDEQGLTDTAVVGQCQIAEESGMKVTGEASKVFQFLQSKIKDRNEGGTVLEMENGNGAYIWPKGKEDAVGTAGLPKHNVAPRIPLVDLSNAGNSKGKGNAKSVRKSGGGAVLGVIQAPRQPFPKDMEFCSTKFSGFFWRCPPEDSLFMDGCRDRGNSDDAEGDNVQDSSSGCAGGLGVGMSMDN